MMSQQVLTTVFENHIKSLIQHCERRELRLHTYWVYKSSSKVPKMVHFGEFLKTWSLQSNSVTRRVTFKRLKIGWKRQNSKIQNVTFLLILKHCADVPYLLLSIKSWAHFLWFLPTELYFSGMLKKHVMEAWSCSWCAVKHAVLYQKSKQENDYSD